MRVRVQGQRKYQPLWMWHIHTFEQQFVLRSGQKLQCYTTALCVLLIKSQSRSKQTRTPGCWARDPCSCFGNVAFSVSLQSYLSVKMSDLRSKTTGVVAYRPAKMAPSSTQLISGTETLLHDFTGVSNPGWSYSQSQAPDYRMYAAFQDTSAHRWCCQGQKPNFETETPQCSVSLTLLYRKRGAASDDVNNDHIG